MTEKNKSNKMWGGRFNAGPDALMEEINASVDFDKRLYKQDIEGSQVHALMLAKQGIIDNKEADLICDGLSKISLEIETDKFTFSKSLEDIHMNVEARLSEIIGDVAGKLHTARSRNDQVALDFRMWVRDQIDLCTIELRKLIEVFISQAEQYDDLLMPGFTHMQAAQPVTWSHHMMAYVEMFGRDLGRFKDARLRMNECPLGGAALAGTSFPIDRDYTSKELGFDRPTANSLDSTSDRDFALDFLSSASICAVHISRLAEELIIWNSDIFKLITLDDKMLTGSSIMPQKKNPDLLEYLRGKSGSTYGNLFSMLTILKGLPLSYFKDLQDDKEIVFKSNDTLINCLKIFDEILKNSSPNKKKMLSLIHI